MYKISKRMEIAGAHRLMLDYGSPCQELHGHNWIITVHCKGRKLNDNGMLFDFAHIKKRIKDKFDHKNLNDVLPEGLNPTAENLAYFISQLVNTHISMPARCYKVTVQESEGNIATWKED